MVDKQVISLIENSLVELDTLKKLGELPATQQLSIELKKLNASGELEAMNPLLTTYVASIVKNVGFLLGTYNSVHTHAENRTGELQELMAQLSKAAK
ncbi:hypothetical protein [Weissella diestrammenae]|nr:hypothetical protein [Weissella diestrammenae]